MRTDKKGMPTALTIAGSDSGGGAGIQADLLTFAAHGVFGTTAIAALTAQNPNGVSSVFPVSAEFVREQADQIARFFCIGAAKTGMLFNAAIITAVADFFERHCSIPLVLDPVMIATSGARLLEDDAIVALRERLIPLATLLTPNLDEAEVLLGKKFSWRNNAETQSHEIQCGAEALAEKLGVAILLKGGHGNGNSLTDALAFPSGHDSEKRSKLFSSQRILGINTHGSGCTLSAGITANLALSASNACIEENFQEKLIACVERSRDYLSAGMKKPLPLSGERFIAHLPGKQPADS